MLVFVWGVFPIKMLSVHVERAFHDCDSGNHGLECITIRNMNLYAAAGLAGVLLKGGHESAGAEINARKIELRQGAGEIISIYLRAARELKGLCGSPPFGHLLALHVAG